MPSSEKVVAWEIRSDLHPETGWKLPGPGMHPTYSKPDPDRLRFWEKQGYPNVQLVALVASGDRYGKPCWKCGCRMVFIRGRYPGDDDREVCPTCQADRLEIITETANPNPPAAKMPGEE